MSPDKARNRNIFVGAVKFLIERTLGGEQEMKNGTCEQIFDHPSAEKQY
jgi:hypothetical protein